MVKSVKKFRIEPMSANNKKITLSEDDKEGVGLLLKDRIPWLAVGLLGGVGASFLISRFEEVISQNISLAFFLPLIVYMSSAVGTQTETIFVRDLTEGKAKFFSYLFKEMAVGLLLGLLFGSIVSLIAYVWIDSLEIATTVGLAMAVNISIAPIVALVVPEILFKEHTDPALGAGPFTTIVSDIISISIYLLVASFILFS